MRHQNRLGKNRLFSGGIDASFTVIFIDGRFRVAYGLNIFPKIRNDTLVVIHVYEDRNVYHVLEKYYIKVKKWDTLSSFFKNKNI